MSVHNSPNNVISHITKSYATSEIKTYSKL